MPASRGIRRTDGICSRCGDKPRVVFKSGKRDVYCKDCERETNRRHRMKWQYGITPEQYDEMFDKQKGTCAICGHSPEGRRLDVDHCHRSGEVRGLLCNKCNQAIGLFNDEPNLIERALEYLVSG